MGKGREKACCSTLFNGHLIALRDWGIHAVEVDARDYSTAAFYRKYGFAPLLDDPLYLFLPLSTVDDLLK